MAEPKRKLVKVDDSIIAFPDAMPDEHVATVIKSFRAKKTPQPLATEESEHARQLKPAQPLDSAIPTLPKWANTPLAPILDKKVDYVDRALWPGGTANWDKGTAAAEADKQKFMTNHPIGGGIFEGVSETAEGLTTPANLALMILAPESKIMSGLFAIQALHGSYKDVEEARKAYREGRNAEASKYATQAILNLGIAGLAGHHAVKDVPVPEPVKAFMKDESGFVDPIKQWPQFKQWFGNSKVVDEAGKPKVVFHGTQKDFEAFDPKAPHQSPNTDDSVLFFTNHPAIAETYSGKNETGSNIIPAYLSLKNPMVIDGLDRRTNTPFPLFKVVREDAIKHAREKGYDGIIVKNTADRGGYGYPDTGPTDVYIVFDPTQVKSAIGNSGAFDPKSGSLTDQRAPKLADVKAKAAELKPTTAYKSVDQSQPFYLKSENLINEKMKGPMPAEDVHKMLLSNGVKPEEMKWTGLDEFLTSKGKGKVTPQEIQEHLAGNNLQVQEVMKGTGGLVFRNSFPTFDELNAAIQGDEMLVDASGKLRRGLCVEQSNDGWNLYDSSTKENPTKFGSYALPGAEPGSYRELLVTMPEDSPKVQRIKAQIDELISLPAAETMYKGEDRTAAYDRLRKELTDAGGSYAAKNSNAFRSSHWDEPNPASHVRFDTHIGPNGEKILVIQEMQDDWAQQGRKVGYKGNRVPTKATRHDGYWEVHDQDGNFITNIQDWQHPEIKNEEHVLKEAQNRLVNNPERIRNDGKVPDRPFKKTDEWTSLVMKRMVRYAAEHGYDGVAWAPGSVHFDRWGSQRFDWKKNGDHWEVAGTEQHGGNAGGVNIEEEAERQGYLQKGAAKVKTEADLRKIVKQVMSRESNDAQIDTQTKKIWTRMQNEDSGTSMPRKEGFEAYYDQIVPQAANKLGKQWGAKVGETTINPAINLTPQEEAIVKEYQRLDNEQGAAHSAWLRAKDDNLYAELTDKSRREMLEQEVKAHDHWLRVRQQRDAFMDKNRAVFNKNNAVRDAKDIEKKVPYLPITPQMRAGVKSIPFSLFSIPLAAGALTLAQVKEKADKLRKGEAQ